ncbi:MAG: hypothetical protein ABW019_08920 [Chitinophagaceae bacterium]
MSRNLSSDQVLIEHLRQSASWAFEELFRRYWHTLYMYSLRKLRCSDEARRVVRTIFTQLWEKRQAWPVHMPVSGYLYAEVRRASLQSLYGSECR